MLQDRPRVVVNSSTPSGSIVIRNGGVTTTQDRTVTTVAIRTEGIQGAPGAPGDGSEASINLINSHVASPTPHPSYDDLPSLTLLFENGLV